MGSDFTVVLSGRAERSRVTPDGTATLDKTMVEHDFCDLLARDAPLAPKNVQLVARLTRPGSGAGVISGPATGEARTEAARVAKNTQVRETMAIATVS